MKPTQQSGILNQIVCVNLDIHLFYGRKQLRLDDLKNVSNDQVPPRELASLGSKRVCDGDEIQKFVTVKRKAERACEQVAARFLGAYATSEVKINDLTEKLNEYSDEFKALKKSFLDRYDDIIRSWKKKNPEWESLIERNQTPKNDIERQLRFDYQVFRVAEVAGLVGVTGQEDFHAGLNRAAVGLAGQLFNEVARDAEYAYEHSFKGRDSVTRRVLFPINSALEKLDSLSFIDERIGPVMRRINKCLNDLPKTGPIEGNDLNALLWLMSMLADAGRMQEYGQAVLDGIMDDDDSPTLTTSDLLKDAGEQAIEIVPSEKPAEVKLPAIVGTYF
ncbi:MAG: DUF3150 domain-containing protein [Sulfuricaulis sp.]